ncbi:MAG: ABC transporter permease [Bacilli bacterium]|jgi:ATP-binding cassette subfamily B protein
MKFVIKFLKPHFWLCFFTILFTAIDVIGGLIIPTLMAQLLNEGTTAGTEFSRIIQTIVWMIIAAVIGCAVAIGSAFTCAELVSKVGSDMRKDLYRKTLLLSGSDFGTFGTASMTTRTVSDITNIQTALINFFQMVTPVPVIFIVSLALSFHLDWLMGLILLGVLLLISLVAAFIMKSTSPLFKKLQKKLDKVSKVFLENLTGVRVIRAFNKEKPEQERLNGEFTDYAQTSIKVNKHFASLDGISMIAINLFVFLFVLLLRIQDNSRIF